MSKKSKLSAVEIAGKLKAKIKFTVETPTDRQRVLTGAKFLGIEVSTRQNEDKTFTVFPI